MKKKKPLFLLILFFLFLFLGENVYAEDMNIEQWINEENETDDGSEEKTSTENETSGATKTIFNIVKTLIVLACILFLIYIVLRFLNRNNTIQTHKVIKNLGGVSVGPNKSMQIIRIGRKYYLIGVGENVELLDEIKDESIIEELNKEQEQDQLSIVSSTVGQVKNILNKKDKDDSFNNLFEKELNKLKNNYQKARQQSEERNKNNE